MGCGAAAVFVGCWSVRACDTAFVLCSSQSVVCESPVASHGLCPLQASVLPTPYGPVAVLGPSVDELRRVLLVARTALSRGAYEPPWCGTACGVCPGAAAGGVSPRAAAGIWGELLTAAEQLVNV